MIPLGVIGQLNQSIGINPFGTSTSWTLVQHSVNNGGASIAFPLANTAGNLLVAGINCGTTVQLPTDTAGNTWFSSSANAVNGATSMNIYYAPNCKAGSNTVSSTNGFDMQIFEIAGAVLTNPIDTTCLTSNGTTVGTTNNMLCSMTTTKNNDFVVCAGSDSSGVMSVGTNIAWIKPDLTNDPKQIMEYIIQSTAGPITGSISNATSGDNYFIMAICV